MVRLLPTREDAVQLLPPDDGRALPQEILDDLEINDRDVQLIYDQRTYQPSSETGTIDGYLRYALRTTCAWCSLPPRLTTSTPCVTRLGVNRTAL